MPEADDRLYLICLTRVRDSPKKKVGGEEERASESLSARWLLIKLSAAQHNNIWDQHLRHVNCGWLFAMATDMVMTPAFTLRLCKIIRSFDL